MTRLIQTIGHSNHELDALLELLRRQGIVHVVDLRSSPFSSYSPQFTNPGFERSVTSAGFRYTHLQSLGGRPDTDEMYDSRGHVLYGKVAESESFRLGLQELEAIAVRERTVILCSEENPEECHRRLLVGRVLLDRGWEIHHIRRDGRVESEDRLAGEVGVAVEDGLFEGGEYSTWKSTRSVSRRRRPRNSSER